MKKKTKNKVNKSKAKKKTKKTKKAVQKKSTQEIRIVVQAAPVVATTEKDLEPIKEKSKYMIPKTWVSETQVLRMVQKTPPQHIYERPAKGGGKWKYVTGNYVEKILNFTFGWNWDFEIVNHGKEGDMVWVHGKLTVKDDKGHTITKSQFGRADIKFKTDFVNGKKVKTKDMLDYGNDLKSATTDALKKCASLLGIASDVYGKTEIKAETGQEVHETTNTPSLGIKGPISEPINPQALQKGQVLGPDGLPTWVCSVCGDPISDQTHDYSKKVFGKPLCREHQNNKK